MNLQSFIFSFFLVIQFIFGSTLFAQETKRFFTPRPLTPEQLAIVHHGKQHSQYAPKSSLCRDTLRYSYQKQKQFGNETMFFVNIVSKWNETGGQEKVSQGFINSDSLTITGLELEMANDSTFGKVEGVTAQFDIYEVDNFFKPTNLLGSQSIHITDTILATYIVEFDNPVTVTGNYAIVLSTPNLGESCWFVQNDYVGNQSWDESYTHWWDYIYGDGWKPISVWFDLTIMGEPYPDNWDWIVNPIVEYSLSASADMTPNPAVIETQTVFTNTTNEAFLTNRMMSTYAFFDYFLSIHPDTNFVNSFVDSTWVWNLDIGQSSPELLTKNASYTYPPSDTIYHPKLTINGGFSLGCSDETSWNIHLPPPVSGIEQTNWDNIDIYPNPFSEQVIIDGLDNQLTRLSLTNLQGQVIYSQEITSSMIILPTEQLSKGLYILSLQSDHTVGTQKIIKR